MLLACLTLGARGAETLFVQAVKADLREAPRADGGKLVELKRGTAVDVLEKKGLWVRAKADTKTGWISKLFLSANRPVGQADLQNAVPEEVEKASRRRSSSYNVSAASRGLMTDERTREGRTLYATDFEQLEAMEKYEVPSEKLKQFQTSGKLRGNQ
jgi:hypothetical protein